MVWLAAAASSAAAAAEVELVGLFPGRAVLVIDGGSPRTVAVGAMTREGVKLIETSAEGAIVQVNGRRVTLRLGDRPISLDAPVNPGRGTVTLMADRGGHYVSSGTVNGVDVRFMVDTGATFVSLGRSDALRAGIDLSKGQAGFSQTANGVAQVWKVKLHTVRVGDITLHDIDGVVHATDLPVALLGLSFLNRMEMRREGDALTLRRRY